jgi:hypothetical protein
VNTKITNEKRGLVESEIIPVPIRQTLEWLLQIEAFEPARNLAHTVFGRLPSDDPRSTDFLAYILYKSRFYKEAADVAVRTVALRPDSVDAKFNAAKCLNANGRPDDAEKLIREVISARPDWAGAKIDLALYVSLQGRHDEAMQILLKTRPLLDLIDKDLSIVDFNLGWHLIRHGNFKEGMRNLAGGRELGIWGTLRGERCQRWAAKPVLRPGADLHGKTVLICGEGGAGDEMINVRFAGEIQRRGGDVIWAPQKPLESIFKRVAAVRRVVTVEESAGCEYDFWAPCMDLPSLLDVELNEIPKQPYLAADPELIERWRSDIPQNGNLRVGIRWQGNALYEQDLMRSVPFNLFERLFQIPGIDFYSLQRDEGREELREGAPVKDLGDKLLTWEDTAAAVANLDLVISSCTSVPHLSSAMGKETWLLCPLNFYYIWATPGNKSPWYESIKLFRQTELRSWQEPFELVFWELTLKARNRPVVMVRPPPSS